MEDVLKIELFRYKTLVFGSILHQDESKISRGKTCFSISNGFSFKSNGRPELGSSKTLYLRGTTTSLDNRPLYINFDTEEEAIEYGRKLAYGIKEFNNSFRTTENKLDIPSQVEQIL